MIQKPPERLTWALKQLAPRADDRILEIGCGSGVLLGLLCEKVANGRVTGIDRSPHAIETAQRRNRAHISAGKATVQVVPFEEMSFAPGTFNKIVAVHVNSFWTSPGSGVQKLAEALSKDGALYLIYQAIPGAKTGEIAPILKQSLRSGGFGRITVKSEPLAFGRAICVCARRPHR